MFVDAGLILQVIYVPVNTKSELGVFVAITDTGSAKLPQSQRSILVAIGSLVQFGSDLGERALH